MYHFFMIKKVGKITATSERDVWEISKSGDVRGLKEMIEFGVDVNMSTDTQETLLHLYLLNYLRFNRKFVKILIKKGINVQATTSPVTSKDGTGSQNILHYALRHSFVSYAAIKYILLKTEVSLNATDLRERTPVMCYLERNTDVKRTVLELLFDETNKGIRKGKNKITDKDRKNPYLGHLLDKSKNSILHYACKNCDISDNNIEYIMNFFLLAMENESETKIRIKIEKEIENLKRQETEEQEEEEHDINKKNNKDNKSYENDNGLMQNFQMAVLSQKTEEIKKNRNKNKQKKDKDKNKDRGKVIMKTSSDVNESMMNDRFRFIDLQNINGETSFMLYLGINNQLDSAVIHLFMEKGVNFCTLDYLDNSVFHWIVKNDYINLDSEPLKFLLQRCLDLGFVSQIFVQNKKGESPLHVYCNESIHLQIEIIQLFMEYQSETTVLDKHKSSILHNACANPNSAVDFIIHLLEPTGGKTYQHLLSLNSVMCCFWFAFGLVLCRIVLFACCLDLI